MFTLRLEAPTLSADAPESPAPSGTQAATYLRLLRPMLLLLAVTLAGGAAIEMFTPQMVDDAAVAAGGLFVMGLSAALSRWRIGVLADRQGVRPFLVPLVVLMAMAMALLSWSLAGTGGVRIGSFLAAMLLLGLCYGGLQNLTLLMSFASVERRHHNLASAVWNVGFDAGTALGSVAVGVVAELASFATAMLVAGAVAVATLPLAVRRVRTPSGPSTT